MAPSPKDWAKHIMDGPLLSRGELLTLLDFYNPSLTTNP